jgi:hypothetical protein
MRPFARRRICCVRLGSLRQDELWLQQVGGGEPIQLTHSTERVDGPSFFPDGKQILYLRILADKKSTIETIATLGGAPKALIQVGQMGDNDPKLSPDGRQISYVENRNGWHLMMVSSAGGQPREIQAFAATPGILPQESTWTSDSRYLSDNAQPSVNRKLSRNGVRISWAIRSGKLTIPHLDDNAQTGESASWGRTAPLAGRGCPRARAYLRSVAPARRACWPAASRCRRCPLAWATGPSARPRRFTRT